MRFRITKSNDGTVYSMVVTGKIDDEAGWDILQIAQTMLHRPLCKELIIDVRSAQIDSDLSVFATDTLASVFEEGLWQKDSALVVRYADDGEIRLRSDQLLLTSSQDRAHADNREEKYFNRTLRWLEQGARSVNN